MRKASKSVSACVQVVVRTSRKRMCVWPKARRSNFPACRHSGTIMALIKAKPTSPGRRFQVKIDRSHLHKGGPVEALLVRKNSTGARNHFGRITTRHQGAGHKQHYRVVDFLREKDGV